MIIRDEANDTITNAPEARGVSTSFTIRDISGRISILRYKMLDAKKESRLLRVHYRDGDRNCFPVPAA